MPTEENNRKIAEFEASLKSAEAEAIPIIDAAFAGWSAGLAIDEKPFEGKGFPDALTELLKKPKQDRTDAEKTAMAQGLRKHFDEKVKAAVVGKTPLLEKVELLKKQLADYRGDQLPRVMIMSDSQPRETKRFDRGDYLSPKETVSFSTPAFLPPQALDAPRNRLGFAQWLLRRIIRSPHGCRSIECGSTSLELGSPRRLKILEFKVNTRFTRSFSIGCLSSFKNVSGAGRGCIDLLSQVPCTDNPVD